MIEIKDIYLESDSKYSKLVASININGDNKKVWYKVSKDNGKYLTAELADSFFVAALPYAIKHNINILISEKPISSKILYNVRNYLLPALKSNINISAKYSDMEFHSNENGSGMSCGIDSFYTLYKYYYNDVPESLKMDSITFFNVGAHNGKTEKEKQELFNKRAKIPTNVSNKLNIDLLTGDSNLDEIFPQLFKEVHTFRNISFILALQKKYKNYYYSSGASLEEFDILSMNPAKWDIFLLSMLSNQNVTFYSSGCTEDRLEKTNLISTLDIVKDNLLVCFNDDHNCCLCEKCMRTLFSLMALEKIELFSKSFDSAIIKANLRKLQIKFMSQVYKKRKSDYRIIYYELQKTKYKISFVRQVEGYIYHFLRDYIKGCLKHD